MPTFMTGYRIQNSGFRIKDTEYRILTTALPSSNHKCLLRGESLVIVGHYPDKVRPLGYGEAGGEGMLRGWFRVITEEDLAFIYQHVGSFRVTVVSCREG